MLGAKNSIMFSRPKFDIFEPFAKVESSDWRPTGGWLDAPHQHHKERGTLNEVVWDSN
jgi:hypothetical protein